MNESQTPHVNPNTYKYKANIQINKNNMIKFQHQEHAQTSIGKLPLIHHMPNVITYQWQTSLQAQTKQEAISC